MEETATTNTEGNGGGPDDASTPSTIDGSLIRSPAVAWSLGTILIALAVLLWPDRTTQALARMVGLGLVWLALMMAIRGSRSRDWQGLLIGLSALAVGVLLLLTTEVSTSFIGQALGGFLMVSALVQLIRPASSDQRRARIAAAATTFAGGALLLAYPERTLTLLVSMTAIASIGLAVIVILKAIETNQAGTVDTRSPGELLKQWFHDRPQSDDDRQLVYSKTLYDGPDFRSRVVRFAALMTFASVIASMGVVTDSTAVVIGAMLIAPLLTPLMGVAVSLVMGWPDRLARTAMVAAGGIVLAITIGLIIGLSVPAVIDTTANGQIVSRSNPTVLDLIIAAAAGTAGAYGLSRPDVSDSLPGVAIAIALVPPLGVVGISYSQGDWRSGNGALLLFTTNMVAILIFGGLTFIATGITPVERVADNQRRMKTVAAALAVLTSVVVASLFLNGEDAAANLLEKSTIEDATEDWLAGAGSHRLVSVSIADDVVSTIIAGPADEDLDVESLAEELSDALGRPVDVDVRVLVEERLSSIDG